MDQADSLLAYQWFIVLHCSDLFLAVVNRPDKAPVNNLLPNNHIKMQLTLGPVFDLYRGAAVKGPIDSTHKPSISVKSFTIKSRLISSGSSQCLCKCKSHFVDLGVSLIHIPVVKGLHRFCHQTVALREICRYQNRMTSFMHA